MLTLVFILKWLFLLGTGGGLLRSGYTKFKDAKMYGDKRQYLQSLVEIFLGFGLLVTGLIFD